MIVTRCLCCGKAMRPSGSRSWAICLFITSWVMFIIAAECLLTGSVRNAYHTKYRDLLKQSAPSCETMRKGVFGVGAAFIVLTCIASEIYYIKVVNEAFNENSNARFSNICRNKGEKNKNKDYPWEIYTSKELLRATNNFHQDHKIGEGGFGSVYWGRTSKGVEAIIFIFFFNYTHDLFCLFTMFVMHGKSLI
ncbi:hypothetical protein AHAS_Ahas09G0224200 [Arachis hypogaea]